MENSNERAGLSEAELAAEDGVALPDKEVVSILDLNADLDLAIDAAAPIDLGVAANANVAAPIDAAVGANVLSEGSTAQALSDQGALINQDISADATANATQDSAWSRAPPRRRPTDRRRPADHRRTDGRPTTATAPPCRPTAARATSARPWATSAPRSATWPTATCSTSTSNLDGDANIAAPINGAVAANANVAAPIDASVAANVGSVDSDAVSVAQQDAIINQDIDGSRRRPTPTRPPTSRSRPAVTTTGGRGDLAGPAGLGAGPAPRAPPGPRRRASSSWARCPARATARPPALARRADGQVVQLTPLLYLAPVGAGRRARVRRAGRRGPPGDRPAGVGGQRRASSPTSCAPWAWPTPTDGAPAGAAAQQPAAGAPVQGRRHRPGAHPPADGAVRRAVQPAPRGRGARRVRAGSAGGCCSSVAWPAPPMTPSPGPACCSWCWRSPCSPPGSTSSGTPRPPAGVAPRPAPWASGST